MIINLFFLFFSLLYTQITRRHAPTDYYYLFIYYFIIYVIISLLRCDRLIIIIIDRHIIFV